MLKKTIIFSIIVLIAVSNSYTQEIGIREEEKITQAFMLDLGVNIGNLLIAAFGLLMLDFEYQVLIIDILSISINPSYLMNYVDPLLAAAMGLGMNLHLFNKGLEGLFTGFIFKAVYSRDLDTFKDDNYEFSFFFNIRAGYQFRIDSSFYSFGGALKIDFNFNIDPFIFIKFGPCW
ncbi:MAG: hypothetical protein JXB88_02690 [Spirochaetales bacterium]|nr:hypothetical protein [Spirochaetales bacterium]